MKTILRIGLPLLAAAQIGAQTAVHPGFTLTNLRPTGFDPMVSGLDFLSDGRLVLATWEDFGKGKSRVYLLSNVTTGDASKVTVTPFYDQTGLNEVLGVKVVDDKIYVLQRDQLSYLPDANKDGKADEIVKVASGWGVNLSDPRKLEFAMGLAYKDSAFYGGLATSWPLEGAQANERGCIIKMTFKGTWEAFACGMRTPNGIALGPDGEVFATENQGNWVPSSKLLHVEKGRFFGVHKSNPGPGPFDNAGETPPAIWMDHGAIAISPTQPVFMTSGPFKGQMIAGDNNLGTLQRYFLEKVGGAWQGAIFRFSAGLDAAANRIVAGPDGAFYVGGIGTDKWSGWWWNSRRYGMQRLAPNGKAFFDMLAVRSKGPAQLEIEFTSPAGEAAATAANYRVQQWKYTPELAYGKGKQATPTNLTAKKATLSADKKKVLLDIDGMLAKNVVYLKLNNITGAANEALVGTEAWYTQNAFGPGTDPVVVDVRAASRGASAPRFAAHPAADGRWTVAVAEAGAYTLELLDLKGRVLETHGGRGPSEISSRGAYASGLVLARLRAGDGAVSSRVLCQGR